MAINLNLPNFLHAPVQDNGIGNLLSNALKSFSGMQNARHLPQQLQRTEQQELLNNEKKQLANALEKQFGARREEADIGLKESQAEQQRKFGGLTHLSGPARDVMSYELSKAMHGENSPITQAIKERMDASLEHQKQLNEYYDIQNRTAGFRHSTPFAKALQEAAMVEQGLMPNIQSQTALSPEQKKKIKGQYGLKALKETTDPFTRRAIEQSVNVHKTLSKIDVDALTQYSGVKGLAERAKDEANAQLGKPSDRFEKYHESETAAKSLAKQIRQLLGDSITVSAQESLNALANPSSLRVPPDVAKKKFKQYVNILEDEMKTFRESAQSPEPFFGGTEAPSAAPRSINGDNITLIHNGESYNIPIEKAEAFKKWSMRNSK